MNPTTPEEFKELLYESTRPLEIILKDFIHKRFCSKCEFLNTANKGNNTNEASWEYIILSQGDCLYKLSLLVLKMRKREEQRMKCLASASVILMGIVITGCVIL